MADLNPSAERSPEAQAATSRAIRREKMRLRRLLKEMDPERLKAADKLLDSAAFLAATLGALQEQINCYGPVIRWQNGPDQWGVKRSPEADLYAVYMPQYRATVRALFELLPGGATKPEPALPPWMSGDGGSA